MAAPRNYAPLKGPLECRSQLYQVTHRYGSTNMTLQNANFDIDLKIRRENVGISKQSSKRTSFTSFGIATCPCSPITRDNSKAVIPPLPSSGKDQNLPTRLSPAWNMNNRRTVLNREPLKNSSHSANRFGGNAAWSAVTEDSISTSCDASLEFSASLILESFDAFS